MIDKKDFIKINQELKKIEKLREEIIRISRKVLIHSKKAIYCLHRDDIKKATRYLGNLQSEKRKLDQYIEKNPELYSFSIYNAAIQEYVEAASYLGFVKNKKIPSSKELEVVSKNYLLGLCDLTGELARRAVFSTIKEDYDHVKVIKLAVDQIYLEFLNFDLRNSELRKKSDSIKWNLKKIDEILYDLKIREKN